MKNPLKASDMIAVTRDFCGEHDIGEIPDGYPSDENYYKPGIKILPWINYGIRDLTKTGFNRCYFDHSILENVSEYTISRNVGSVISASLYDDNSGRYVSPFTRTSLLELETLNPGWRNIKSSVPSHWYQVGAGSFGLYPKPNRGDYTFILLADSMPEPLTGASNYPTQLYDSNNNIVGSDDELPETVLPVEFHVSPCKYAAWWICAQRGKESLAAEWKASYMDDFVRLSDISLERLENTVYNPVIQRRVGSNIGWRRKR